MNEKYESSHKETCVFDQCDKPKLHVNLYAVFI